MRRFAKFALLLGVALGFTTSAQAGALSTLRLGVINQLEDNDFESAVLGDGDNLVEPGDFLVGMFEMQSLRVPPGGPVVANYTSATDNFTGVFLLRVATATDTSGGAGTAFSFTFSPPAAADWTNAAISLNAVVAGGMTMAVVYDEGPTSPAEHIEPDIGTLPTSLDTGEQGTKLWEFGFTGADPDEFWGATTADAGGAANDITAIDTLAFAAAINVTHSTAAVGGIILLPHDHIGFGGDTQVQLVGTLALGQNPANSDFDIATDTDIFILPVPEPGSLSLLALGLTGLGAAGWRRRRKLAA